MSTGNENGSVVSWKQGVATALLVVFTITLPATWLFRSAIDIVSDREQVSTFLYENLLSDEALPGAIRKALEYQAWLTRFEDPLEQRVIVSALSGVKPEQMLELFGYVAPEKERRALLDGVTSALYDWLEGEETYPALTIQTGTYLNNVQANAENLLLWVFGNFPIPACGPNQIRVLERGNYGDDLKRLISCLPPESLQKKTALAGAALLKAQLAENNPPEVVDVGAKMKESAPVKKIATAKRHTRRLFFAGSTLWLVPVLLLFVGLALVARSVEGVAIWLSWPLALTGILGLIIGSRLPEISFLHSVPHEAPENVPGAVVGIGRKIGIDLAAMLESAMFTPFLILAVVGGILLVVTRREKIVQLTGRTRELGSHLKY